MYVIEREIEGRKHYYAGYISEYSPNAFSDSGIQWNVTKTPYTRLDSDTADKVLKQLAEMGVLDATKVVAFEKKKKAGK